MAKASVSNRKIRKLLDSLKGMCTPPCALQSSSLLLPTVYILGQ